MTAQPKNPARTRAADSRKQPRNALGWFESPRRLAEPCAAVAAELRLVSQDTVVQKPSNTTKKGELSRNSKSRSRSPSPLADQSVFFGPDNTHVREIFKKLDSSLVNACGSNKTKDAKTNVPSSRKRKPSPPPPSVSAEESGDPSPPPWTEGMAEGTAWLAGQARTGRSAAQAVADLAGAPGWSMASAAACWREWLRGLGSELEATSRRERLAVAVEQREALAEQAWKNGDLRMALAAWDSRDRFLGLLDRDADDNQHAALTLARLMELARQPG